MRSFISSLLATRKMTAPDKSVPFRIAWLMAGVMAAAWRGLNLKGEPPITRQMLRLIGKPFTISIRKAQAELGYAPQVTMEEGLAAMRQNEVELASSPAHLGERRASIVT